jgi:hypothetical protein
MKDKDKIIAGIITMMIIITFCCIFSSSIWSATYYANQDVDVTPVEEEEEIGNTSDILEKVIPGQVPDKASEDTNNVVIKLYDSDNYKGLIGSFKPGKYSFDKGGKYKKLNDDISSFEIAKGYIVYLFKDTDYKNIIGKTNKSVPSLKKLKNEISSMLVTKM